MCYNEIRVQILHPQNFCQDDLFVEKLVFMVDDAVNLTSEKHDPNAQMSHLHKRKKQKDLAEGIGVVLAKYPPKVKLEIFSQFYSARKGSIMRTLMREGIGAFIVMKPCLLSL